jgi:phage repressor protein C with HTH and peptisase S24 domain
VQEEISYSPNAAATSYAFGMDAVRQLILDKSRELDKSLASLSRKIGKKDAYLQQFIKRGSPKRLGENERRILAQELSVDETELGATAPASRGLPNARIAGPVRLSAVIPVYGHAVGGSDGEFMLNGNQIGELAVPPTLAGVDDAYAVYVVGDSMLERYHAGEAVYVHPRMPLRKGDFVVAQIASSEGEAPYAYVKKFLGWTAKTLRLEQLNPRKTLEFPRQRVVSVHRIVLGGDG